MWFLYQNSAGTDLLAEGARGCRTLCLLSIKSILIESSILQRLTGGILLSRNKEYIVFYRGKDFLPSAVSSAIEERRKSRSYGEKQLMNVSSTAIGEESAPSAKQNVSVSRSETGGAHKVSNWSHEQKTKSIEAAIMRTSRKLSMVGVQLRRKDSI